MSGIDFMVTSTWPSNNELRGTEPCVCVCVRESEIEEESWPRSVQFSANICPTFVNSVIPREVQ